MVNNGNSKVMREVFSELTMKTPERQRRRFVVTHSDVSFVEFEQVNTGSYFDKVTAERYH